MSSILYSLSRIWARDGEAADSDSRSSQQVLRSPDPSVNETEQQTFTPLSDDIEFDGGEPFEFSDTSTRRNRSARTAPPNFSRSISARETIEGKLEYPFIGHGRAGKIKARKNMWNMEDSGYGSPLPAASRHESRTNVAAEKDGESCQQDKFGNCLDDDPGVGHSEEINDNNGSIIEGGEIDDTYFGLKPSYGHPLSKYSCIPSIIQNYRYQPRRPHTAKPNTAALDESLGGLHDISLAGMSPGFTSTPIKATSCTGTKLDLDCLDKRSDDGSFRLSESCPFWSHSQPKASSRGEHLSVSKSSIQEMVDESVSKIVQEGSEEFRGKYSQWIAQVFHFQVDKMQRRLSTQFSKNLELVIQDKEKEILGLQQKYRNKLIDFETSTEKFQKWVETLAEENQRVRETKDAIISEMEKTAADQKEHFRLELDKQINNVQAECEKEKLALQKKHAEQLKTINEKSMEQVTRLEEQFGKQVSSLQSLISELKSQNTTMEDQLTLLKKSSDKEHSVLHNKYANYHKERENLLAHIDELRDKLTESEKEKSTIIASHNEEIFNIQRETERMNQNINNRMTNAQSVVEGLHQRHEEELSQMKKQMIDKESQYKKSIDDLRNTYGHRISRLTKTVEDLQLELVGGRGKSSSKLLV